MNCARRNFFRQALIGHQRAWPAFSYLRLSDTLWNVDVSFVPTPCTTAMMATAIPAAMRPYSMAVAPDSSRMSCTIFDIDSSPRQLDWTNGPGNKGGYRAYV